MNRSYPTRTIKVFVYEGAQSLDINGPVEMFHGANECLRDHQPEPPYRFELYSETGAPARTASGLEIGPCKPLSQASGPCDTLIIPGGETAFDEMKKPHILRFVREMAEQVTRLVSVCSGSVILAEAGLLDGRRATSHWQVCDWMARTYPKIEIDHNALFVRDGNITTSAGVTAGMDMALALVEDDLGMETALDIAQRKVMFMKRPGGQNQFSAHLKAQTLKTEKDRQFAQWILDHLDQSLTVPILASQFAMSERTFVRHFSATFGTTPARHVENCRIETGRRLLEEADQSLEDIARRCGFGGAEQMRRAFQRNLNVSPGAYRERFSRN